MKGIDEGKEVKLKPKSEIKSTMKTLWTAAKPEVKPKPTPKVPLTKPIPDYSKVRSRFSVLSRPAVTKNASDGKTGEDKKQVVLHKVQDPNEGKDVLDEMKRSESITSVHSTTSQRSTASRQSLRSQSSLPVSRGVTSSADEQKNVNKRHSITATLATENARNSGKVAAEARRLSAVTSSVARSRLAAPRSVAKPDGTRENPAEPGTSTLNKLGAKKPLQRVSSASSAAVTRGGLKSRSARGGAIQPDLVSSSLSDLQKTKDQNKKLLEECDAKDASLRVVVETADHAARGFDAMSALVNYLCHQVDAFSCPGVKHQLVGTEALLQAAHAQLAQLKAEKEGLQQDMVELQEKHAASLETERQERQQDLQHLEIRLREDKDSSVQKVLDQHDREVTTLNAYHERHVTDLKHSHQGELQKARQEQERETLQLQAQANTEKNDLQQTHEAELASITERFHQIKQSLGDKVDQLRGECEELRQKAKIYETALHRDTDAKVQAALMPFMNLPAEIDSLKSVIDMRNNELRDLRLQNGQISKQLEELPVEREKVLQLEQQVENLEAIVQMKTGHERHISERYQTLLRRYDTESRTNKRLSMNNEELKWRLSQNDLTELSPGEPTSPRLGFDVEFRRSPTGSLGRSGGRRRRPQSHHGGTCSPSPLSPRSPLHSITQRSLSQPAEEDLEEALVLDEVRLESDV